MIDEAIKILKMRAELFTKFGVIFCVIGIITFLYYMMWHYNPPHSNNLFKNIGIDHKLIKFFEDYGFNVNYIEHKYFLGLSFYAWDTLANIVVIIIIIAIIYAIYKKHNLAVLLLLCSIIIPPELVLHKVYSNGFYYIKIEEFTNTKVKNLEAIANNQQIAKSFFPKEIQSNTNNLRFSIAQYFYLKNDAANAARYINSADVLNDPKTARAIRAYFICDWLEAQKPTQQYTAQQYKCNFDKDKLRTGMGFIPFSAKPLITTICIFISSVTMLFGSLLLILAAFIIARINRLQK